ncbi:DNA-binding NarL/FixJ family response regulator [Chitinophaga dinghuensis]|uniref:DNA-binding NarL/FixJ family response regulator n=1 Tax=Chitinophaga dinghuensis TaxID=1539050 RepID=A0A327VK41_9BACT|nr:response regulator transcription factor [Chitinophaga dinghuensis]RAJ75070.1 DNA-binding NarL/FixJ family response regulator [Chitinophaga dinghuensis]
MQIKLAIADGHPMILNGIKAMLAPEQHIQIRHTCTSAPALFEALYTDGADVLLLDIRLDAANSVTVCKQIKKLYPALQIIVLSDISETYHIRQLIRAGVSGFLLKSADQEALTAAINTVFAGRQYFDQQLQQLALQEMVMGKKRAHNDGLLTKREEEILTLIADEFSNQEIADRLFISLRTVETHRLKIVQKLAVRNTAGLVKEAMRRGLAE